MPRARWKSLVVALVAALAGCGGSVSQGDACPTAKYAAERERWARDLRSRTPLSLNPNAEISIKRDVHELSVGVDAQTFASAFHGVMRDPTRRFGLIRVDRLPENAGKPFQMHERFQGRYELATAGRQSLSGLWKQLFGSFVDDKVVADALCRIENGHTSDFGEIVRLELEPNAAGTYVMEYRYLSGSPIAGSSTFEVTDITDAALLAKLGVTKAARVRQIFLYQEQSESFAKFFTKGGLKLHDQVVQSQVEQSAEAAGTCILDSDIPKEYGAEL